MTEHREQRSGAEAGAASRDDGAPQPRRPAATRRVLIIGGAGMIGAALGRKLRLLGHEVVLAMRDPLDARAEPECRRIAFDHAAPPTPEFRALLGTVDVLVNAAGIFTERAGLSFDDVHVNGPCRLFEDAARAGVSRVIHLSALGASAQAPTAFWRSKGRGDACALRFPGQACVVRPSLVFAPEGTSTRLFLALAGLPFVLLPDAGGARVQPIHQQDLVDGLAALVCHPDPPRELAAVGPVPLPLPGYLSALARAMGQRLRCCTIDDRWVHAAVRLLGRLPGGWLSADGMTMLAHGNTAEAGPWQALVGRPLRTPADFIRPHQVPDLRAGAVLALALPLARAADSITWIVTGWVSAFVYPTAASLALLAQAHVPPAVAPCALYGAAALDAVLGLAMWKRRWRRAVYRVQISVILFYTAVISAWLPGYWTHPYGPVLKNLPMLALIYLLLRLEAPSHGHRHRQDTAYPLVHVPVRNRGGHRVLPVVRQPSARPARGGDGGRPGGTG